MAFSVAAVYAGVDTKSWDVTAGATDTGGVISHGFGAAPKEVQLLPINSVAGWASQWYATTIDASVITLVKSTATDSGDASAQIRILAKRPHSIGA